MVELSRIIPAVDVHTAGEPARIILGGLSRVPGATMPEKKRFMADHLDHLRTLLMHEPRGHRDMFGVVLLPTTTDRADYGLCSSTVTTSTCAGTASWAPPLL